MAGLDSVGQAGLLESERSGTSVHYRVAPGVLAVMERPLAPADA